MANSSTIRLYVPQQDLARLSYDAATPKKVSAWIDALPKINFGQSSRQLYNAIQELNRFKTDYKNRFLILEEMRTSFHYIGKSLGKKILNQSIVLTEQETKITNLAQALQNHLAVGYKIVLLDTLSLKTAEAAKLRTIATHRALTELSGNLLRCYQPYHPTPKGLWREIHQLYLLAEHYGILKTAVEDNVAKCVLTIEHCYFRIMLLSTSRPNQLRQQEMAQLYQAFNILAQYCQLKVLAEDHNPFIVDLSSDEGAVYLHWNKDTINRSSKSLRYIDTSSVAEMIAQRIKNIHDNEGIDLSIKLIASTVLRHLLQSWSASSQRIFSRTTTKGKISLAFGLGAVHHFISDGKDFNTMLLGDRDSLLPANENLFLTNIPHRNYRLNDELRSSGDVWSLQAVNAFNEHDLNASTQAKVQTVFASYACQLDDTSPGGYCLEWQGSAPPQLKTGEITVVKEPEQNTWSIAVVRWIRKISNHSAKLGLELLAPHAEAVALKVIHKEGGCTEYMRVIRLPELKTLGQTSTLITPQLIFKTGNKVMLYVEGEEIKLQLIQEMSATASYSQFEYKIIGEKPNKIIPQKKSLPGDSLLGNSDEEFNSLCSRI